jgi:excisionase family DNA binding protein
MFMNQELKFYTVQEICEILKVKPLTVYRWIKAEKLKAVKVGKNFRIKQEDFEQFINQK